MMAKFVSLGTLVLMVDALARSLVTLCQMPYHASLLQGGSFVNTRYNKKSLCTSDQFHSPLPNALRHIPMHCRRISNKKKYREHFACTPSNATRNAVVSLRSSESRNENLRQVMELLKLCTYARPRRRPSLVSAGLWVSSCGGSPSLLGEPALRRQRRSHRVG